MDMDLVLRYQPHIYKDKNEPFPIRYIGCTVFTEPGLSQSFRNLALDPASIGAAVIIEYAIYYDYDIQHLYDLEHVWVAVDTDGSVCDCWFSFHGMRLRAAGLPTFRVEGTHPVLFAQPGKHALMPTPELFELHPQFHTACGQDAGGGLLIPPFLESRLSTNPKLDDQINQYIRAHFLFAPSLEFGLESVAPDQFLPWSGLLQKIPELIDAQLETIAPTE